MLRMVFVICFLCSTVWANDNEASKEQKQNFCTDAEKTINNENLAKEHPKDEVLIKLVALRIGLCDLLVKDIIEQDFAIDLFEGERVKQMLKLREDELKKQRAKML